jgi:purine nucleosidase
MAKENPGEITICSVGPVTNLALALVKAPEIAKLFCKIVIMGSRIFHPGIHGPQAPMVDANFANDPEAVHIVLRSGADLSLVGMDVTMTTGKRSPTGAVQRLLCTTPTYAWISIVRASK